MDSPKSSPLVVPTAVATHHRQPLTTPLPQHPRHPPQSIFTHPDYALPSHLPSTDTSARRLDSKSPPTAALNPMFDPHQPVVSSPPRLSPPSFSGSSSSSHSSSSTEHTSPGASSSTLSLSPPDPTISSPLTPPEYPFTRSSHTQHCLIPLDYYDSPPSPPTTLEDQMQVAYALDDMHLAKVLLLKLKGIEVTDDNDPRIDQVKDEDFSSSFMPYGPLVLDDESEQRCRDSLIRERERKRRRQRDQRLRSCERIWEASATCFRDDKARVARQKDEDARRRRRLDIEARGRQRHARQNQFDITTRSTRLSASSHHRAVLSYDSLPAAPSRLSNSPPLPRRPHLPTFQYPVMPSVHTLPRHSPPSPKKSPLSSPHRTLLELSSQNVPFSAVIASMQGPLFPVSDDDEANSICGKAKHRSSFPQIHLLNDLLVQTAWGGQDSNVRSRSNIGPDSSLTSSASTSFTPRSTLTRSPSSHSSASSSSNTITTRSATYSSWFSFTGRSYRSSRRSHLSISTVLTSPASIYSSLPPVKPVVSSVIPSASSNKTDNACRPNVRYPSLRTKRALIDTDEDPLRPIPRPSVAFSSTASPQPPARGRSLLRTRTPHTTPFASPSPTSATSLISTGEGLVKRVSRSVSTFMDMASQFQRAYVKATMFTAGSDLYSSHVQISPSSTSRWSRSPPRYGRTVYSFSFSREGSEDDDDIPQTKSRKGGELRPVGYRVLSEDVSIFTSLPLCSVTASGVGAVASGSDAQQQQSNTKRIDEDDIVVQQHRTRPLIPLVPTDLASTKSHPRIFPTPPPIPRSPFRLPYTPSHLTSRLRPVANPLMLRLKAVQNVCEAYGLVYENDERPAGSCVGGQGGVSACAGGHGLKEREAREKVVGVAWEGIGRSGLGWEVSVC